MRQVNEIDRAVIERCLTIKIKKYECSSYSIVSHRRQNENEKNNKSDASQFTHYTSTVCDWIIVANRHCIENSGWWLSVGRGGEKRFKCQCVKLRIVFDCDRDGKRRFAIRNYFFARHNNGSQHRVYFCFAVFIHIRLLLSQWKPVFYCPFEDKWVMWPDIQISRRFSNRAIDGAACGWLSLWPTHTNHNRISIVQVSVYGVCGFSGLAGIRIVTCQLSDEYMPLESQPQIVCWMSMAWASPEQALNHPRPACTKQLKIEVESVECETVIGHFPLNQILSFVGHEVYRSQRIACGKHALSIPHEAWPGERYQTPKCAFDSFAGFLHVLRYGFSRSCVRCAIFKCIRFDLLSTSRSL